MPRNRIIKLLQEPAAHFPITTASPYQPWDLIYKCKPPTSKAVRRTASVLEILPIILVFGMRQAVNSTDEVSAKRLNSLLQVLATATFPPTWISFLSLCV
jgi:hypothetical protein